MTKRKKKINFILLDYEGTCDKHPNSKFLGIEDDGVLIPWCCECLYEMLKESKGLWDVEHKDKKES